MSAITASSPVPDLFQDTLAQYEAGNIPQAAVQIANLLQNSPHRHEVLHLAGDIAAKQQRSLEAINFYQRAVESAADNDARALSWAGIGHVARDTGQPLHAEEAFRRASLAAPHVTQYTLDLAQTFSDQGKFEVALDLLRKHAKDHPGNATPYWAIGALLMQWQRAADALAAYEIAIALDPEYAAVYIYVGAVHAILGDFEKAEQNYRKALSLYADAPAYYQLAQIKKFSPDDSDIAAMEARLDRGADLHIDIRVDAALGLAKAYDDIKDYERAFHFMKMGNDLKRRSVDYSVRADVKVMEDIAVLFGEDFIEHYQGHSGSDLAPIFIVGMPRSGTTLLEQMLAAHSEIKAGGELSYMGRIARELGRTWEGRGDRAPGDDFEVFADLTRSAMRYAELTANLRHRHPRFTDKMPENFEYIGLIHLLFPKSTIIHCRRNPVATCFSCYQRRFGTGNYYTFDMSDLGERYGGYRRMMQHWHEVLPGRILDVQYEETVADPEHTIRRVLDFCGLEFEPACLDYYKVKRAVSTSSNVQVRKPIYRSSLEHWHHYERHLLPLIDSLKQAGVSIEDNA